MNKKGQLDYPIITFFVIIFGLLLLAPIVLKIMNSVYYGVSPQLGNLTGNGGAIAQQNFNAVLGTGINFWDKVVAFAFITSIFLLFVSAFFIDSHPFFIILYIFISFMLILFAPDIVQSLNVFYDQGGQFGTEALQLGFMSYIQTNFGAFLVGIMVITGIIIYGKIAFYSSGRRK